MYDRFWCWDEPVAGLHIMITDILSRVYRPRTKSRNSQQLMSITHTP